MPIIDPLASDPLTDGRQSARALAVRRGVLRLFAAEGIAGIAELPLASGRRADLIGMDRRGEFVIVEIKSSPEDLRADGKWPQYRLHCDRFYFATLPDVPPEIFPAQEGLIIADQWGAEILRGPVETKLAPATRKALTLRFARAAALRLDRVAAHHEQHFPQTDLGLGEIDGN
jgi:hypothetical protein